jgi:tetratricopeptide (TPR) repeat protein
MDLSPQTYDVFLSYNSRDSQAVERVGRCLKDRGLTCFMDRWYLVPGTSWPSALEQALHRSRAVAVFLGPGELGRWQLRELHLALDRQAVSGTRVIPVLLPGADPPLGFLSLNTWVDLRTQLDDERLLNLLAGAVRGLAPAELGPGPEGRPVAPAICPFRGLLPYREEDAPFFFGRQEYTDQLATAVRRRPFVAVLGASGSGKSSVVRAGLVPRLRTDPATVWDVVTMVPTARPLNSLMNAFSPLLWPDLEDEVDRREKANEKTSSLERGTLSLRDLTEIALAKQPGTQRLLLVVDQWEELFTLCRDDKAIRSFTDQLLDASRTSPLTVVFTCRADFYGPVLGYRPLVDRISKDAQVALGPMDERELREVIEAPAARVGLEFEPGLPRRILGDMGREPGRLPLLSFLLEQLWKQRRGAVLTNEAYDAMGGVEGAIATVAESVFQKLPERDQELLPRLFIQLVSVGEESEDTRRRAPLMTLGEEARPLIAGLATARLLVTGSEQGAETVEVAHEALIRHWARSKGWVNQARGFLTWRKRLEPLVDEWRNRDPTALLRGGLLVDAQRWLAERRADLDAWEREFIEASIRQQEKEKRAEAWRKRLLVSLSIAAMVAFAAAAAGALYWEGIQALRRAELAQISGDLPAAERLIRTLRFAEAKELLTRAGDRLGQDGPTELQNEHRRLQGAWQLANELEEIQFERTNMTSKGLFDNDRAQRRYREAFASARLDPDSAGLQELAGKINDSPVRGPILEALDNWALVCAYDMEFSPEHKDQHEQRRDRLLALARAADPGSDLRDRIRTPQLWGDRRQLEELVRLAAPREDLSPQLADLLAELLRRVGGDPEPLLRTFQASHRESFWLNFDLGKYLTFREPAEALRFFQAALAVRPHHIGVLNWMGIIYLHRHDPDRAIPFFEEVLTLDPEFAVGRANLGRALISKGRPKEAIVHFRRALASGARSPILAHSLADLLKGQENYAEAAEQCRTALAWLPGYTPPGPIFIAGKEVGKAGVEAAIRLTLGDALVKQNQVEEALREYSKAVELCRDDADAHVRLGVLLSGKGELEEAIHHFREAGRHAPNLFAAHYNLGLILANRGDLEGAIQAFRDAVRANKDSADAHYQLANALRKNEEMAEAVEHFHHASRLNPRDAKAHHNLGEALRQQGRFVEALDYIKKGQVLSAEMPDGRRLPEKWLRDAEQSVTLERKLPDVLAGRIKLADPVEMFFMGEVCHYKNWYAESARFYHEALKKQPDLTNHHSVQRFRAACSAVLAATGLGAGADSLDAGQRAELRKLARTWLEADLGAWQQETAKNSSARSEMGEKMRRWRRTHNLASVRDEADLVQLPAIEQDAWRKFWSEVDSLLTRAQRSGS